MPLDLTDYELETVARACRALAHREKEDAEKISDPALRAPVQQRAQCAAALAERFERARKRLRMRPNRAPNALKGGVMWGWVKHCFANYAVFNGRAGRPEYWWFYLFTFLGSFVIGILTYRASGFGVSLRGLFWLVTVIPSLAVTSRRLHDTDHSFWWALSPLLVAIPLIAVGLASRASLKGSPAAGAFAALLGLAILGFAVWVLILLAREGDAGPNRFGDSAPTTPS
jgi:uncharacterized membrane protein YhaH (DUF805 family)